MNNMLKDVSDISRRTTRSGVSDKLYTAKNLSASFRALRCSSATLYNTLSSDVQSSVSVASFKHKAVKPQVLTGF